MPGLWRTQASRIHNLAVEVCWRPAQGDVSGDFHDVIDLRDGRVVVLLGDAPGSGPDAARLGEEVRFELRLAFRSTDSCPVAMRRLDELLARRRPEAAVTAVCALLDPESGLAEVTNAGHLPVLLTSGTDARFLDGRSEPPLGVKTERRAAAYPFQIGSALFMFTDGLVERPEGPLGDGLNTALGVARGLTGASAWASELARRTTAELGQPTADATVISADLRRGELGKSP